MRLGLGPKSPIALVRSISSVGSLNANGFGSFNYFAGGICLLICAAARDLSDCNLYD